MSGENDEDEQPGKAGKKNRLFLDFSTWLKSESIHIFHVLLRNKLKEFGVCLLHVFIFSHSVANKPAKAQPGGPACLPEDSSSGSQTASSFLFPFALLHSRVSRH